MALVVCFVRNSVLLNKAQTQFYSASILEVLNYLHNQKVVYRDLKPENIMVLENGYIKFDKSKIGSIHHLDKNSIILVCDEREKPYSNIKRIVKGYDKFITLKETDTVVFASLGKSPPMFPELQL